MCGKAKTGSGKTLGFGLPMLQRIAAGRSPVTEGGPARPRGLVLVPTRELAVQVHEVLNHWVRRWGLHVNSVYGGADIERQIRSLRRAATS